MSAQVALRIAYAAVEPGIGSWGRPERAFNFFKNRDASADPWAAA